MDAPGGAECFLSALVGGEERVAVRMKSECFDADLSGEMLLPECCAVEVTRDNKYIN
jgi:hypothetical protein